MKLENLTFKGGVNVPHYKELTENLSIERAKEPAMVTIPLHQHTGAPCEPLVKVGDKVRIGQNWTIGSFCICTSSFINIWYSERHYYYDHSYWSYC